MGNIPEDEKWRESVTINRINSNKLQKSFFLGVLLGTLLALPLMLAFHYGLF